MNTYRGGTLGLISLYRAAPCLAAVAAAAVACGGSSSPGSSSPAGQSGAGAAAGAPPVAGAAPSVGGASGGGAGGAANAGTGALDSGAGGSALNAGSGGDGAAGTANSGSANGGSPAGGGASGGSPGVGLTKDTESLLPKAGVTIVSYGGYLNGESFQQDGIVSYKGFQYVAFWNSARHVVLARRQLPNGSWDALEFTDYTNTEGDAHNTISIGICPGDGTIHLAFDHHVSTLHYRSSALGLALNASSTPWSTASFSAVSSHLVGNSALTQVTYPRFVTEPGGTKMLFDTRIGSSGSGDEYLWEYDSASHAWSSLGRFIFGTGDSINAYPHGLSYGRSGTRLHLTWCWRDTSDATTNHDLIYVYSDDNGRTWKNNAGTNVATTGTSSVTRASAGVKVWTINQNRGLINQEHMAIDGTGGVHVLLSHLPDARADDPSFDSARTKSQFFHYRRALDGKWTRTPLNLPVVAAFRGKLAFAASGNLYAVLPDLRIAAASAASGYATWQVLDSADSGRFFSDPLIDSARLLSEDKLSVFYPQKASGNLYVLDYSIR